MKRTLIPLTLIFLCIVSCKEDETKPSVGTAKPPTEADVPIASTEKNSDNAMSELETVLSKWEELQKKYASAGNDYGSFKQIGYAVQESDFFAYKEKTSDVAKGFSASTKIKIGDCPAGSVFEFELGCEGICYGNATFPEADGCGSITPKFAKDFSSRNTEVEDGNE